VEDEHGNTIWIRPRMDFGTERRLSVLFGELDRGRSNAKAYEEALLICNVMDWDGPLFEQEVEMPGGTEVVKKAPYSDVMLRRLDPKNKQVVALFTKVLLKIDELNSDPPEPDEEAEEEVEADEAVEDADNPTPAA